MLRAAVFCRLPVSVLLGCQIAGVPMFTDLVGTGREAETGGLGDSGSPSEVSLQKVLPSKLL